MWRGIKNPRRLKVGHYAARLIDLNEYLASFLGATLADKIEVTALDEIILNRMPNSWYKQAYVQGFDCESISFKKAVNMFECMEITEYIYKGVVEPSYKKPTREYANRAGNSRKKRGESASSKTHPVTIESSDKRQKWYVDHSRRKSRTCLIHGLRHSSDECKVLGDFSAKYTKSKPTKYHGNHPIPRKNLTGS